MACQNISRLQSWNTDEARLTYATVEPECCTDVLRAPRLERIKSHDNRQRWPDVQHLPQSCLGSAGKSQIQATWCPQNDGSPLSTHVYRMPRPDRRLMLIESKYLFRIGQCREACRLSPGLYRARQQSMKVVVQKTDVHRSPLVDSFPVPWCVCLSLSER
jgi:hypothetical protein